MMSTLHALYAKPQREAHHAGRIPSTKQKQCCIAFPSTLFTIMSLRSHNKSSPALHRLPSPASRNPNPKHTHILHISPTPQNNVTFQHQHQQHTRPSLFNHSTTQPLHHSYRKPLPFNISVQLSSVRATWALSQRSVRRGRYCSKSMDRGFGGGRAWRLMCGGWR